KSESGYVRSIWDSCFTQTQAQTGGVVIPPGAPSPPFVFHTMHTPWEVSYRIEKMTKRMDKAIGKADASIERAKSHARRERAREKRRMLEEDKMRFIADEQAAYQAEVDRYERELPLFIRSYQEHPTPPPQAEYAFMASYY